MNKWIVSGLLVIVGGIGLVGWILMGGTLYLHQKDTRQVVSTVSQLQKQSKGTQARYLEVQETDQYMLDESTIVLEELQDQMSVVELEWQATFSAQSTTVSTVSSLIEKYDKVFLVMQEGALCMYAVRPEDLPFSNAEEASQALVKFLKENNVDIESIDTIEISSKYQVSKLVFHKPDTAYFEYIVYQSLPGQDHYRAVFDTYEECYLMHEGIDHLAITPTVTP